MPDFLMEVQCFRRGADFCDSAGEIGDLLLTSGCKLRLLIDSRMQDVHSAEIFAAEAIRQRARWDASGRDVGMVFGGVVAAHEECGNLDATLSYTRLRGGLDVFACGVVLDEEELGTVECCARLWARIAERSYAILEPHMIEVHDGNRFSVKKRSIADATLYSVGWQNYWSARYVQRYGEQFFLEMPAHKISRLDDGGVFCQVSPRFLAPSDHVARRTRGAIRNYCTARGIPVKVSAPHYVGNRDYDGQGSERMTREGVLTYINLLLETTVTTNDGKRLKIIPIDWAAMDPSTRDAAIDVLLQRVGQDLALLEPGQILRLEFSQMDDRVEGRLKSEFGLKNALEWEVRASLMDD